MRYQDEVAMSPEDRDEADQRRWRRFDMMRYGMPWADYKEMMGYGKEVEEDEGSMEID